MVQIISEDYWAIKVVKRLAGVTDVLQTLRNNFNTENHSPSTENVKYRHLCVGLNGMDNLPMSDADCTDNRGSEPPYWRTDGKMEGRHQRTNRRRICWISTGSREQSKKRGSRVIVSRESLVLHRHFCCYEEKKERKTHSTMLSEGHFFGTFLFYKSQSSSCCVPFYRACYGAVLWLVADVRRILGNDLICRKRPRRKNKIVVFLF